MFAIVTYDVSQKRVTKVMKICRKYLNHIQNSVFEGMITDGKLSSLKRELSSCIVCSEDSVFVYPSLDSYLLLSGGYCGEDEFIQKEAVNVIA